MREVAADAAVRVEQHEVVVDAVVALEVVVAHRVDVPACYRTCIGMSHMVDVLASGTDDLPELIASPRFGVGFVIAFDVVVRGIAMGCIAIVGVGANETFHVVAAVITVAKMFSTEDGGGELTQYRGLKIAEGFMHDGLELLFIVEGETADAKLGQQVVFADFAPAIIIVVVEGAVKTSIVHIGWQLVLIAFLGKAPKRAIWNDGHIATQTYHGNAVALVFLDDIVANLFLLVATIHGGINLLQGDDLGANAFAVVEVKVVAKTSNPFL